MENVFNSADELLDAVIFNDVQNEWFVVYYEETGLEPVPEDGGHTDEYEEWIVSTVQSMWNRGVRTIKALRAAMADRLVELRRKSFA